MTGGSASDGAKVAASRKAALAAAVSQYAPLAASQVSKIHQNASILEKSNVKITLILSLIRATRRLSGSRYLLLV